MKYGFREFLAKVDQSRFVLAKIVNIMYTADWFIHPSVRRGHLITSQ